MRDDNGIKIGDIITAYHKGYHRVTDIIPRKGAMSLIQYKMIMDSKLNKRRGNEKTCDASYCTVITRPYIEKLKKDQVEHFINGFDLLLGCLDASVSI